MTWRALRRNHTEAAVLFEKKLKPFMKLLNEGEGEWAAVRRNTAGGHQGVEVTNGSADSGVEGPIAVPHLVPLLMLMEGEDPVEDSERGCQLLYNVLQSARSAALCSQDYQRHANALLTGTFGHAFF